MMWHRLDAKDVQKELIEPAVKGTEANSLTFDRIY